MNPVRKSLAIAFLFAAFSGGAVFLYLALYGAKPEPAFATVLPMTKPLPAFSLTDHEGRPFDRDSLRGDWHALFFGFTHCPDICPATLQQLAIARSRVISQGGAFPEIVLVSVDPERDSPEAMAAYVANFGDGVTGVTGSLGEISVLTGELGIFFAKAAGSGDSYNVDHSAAVLLIDPDGNWHSVFSAPHAVDRFVADIPILIGG
jgi:protein SCO1/2